VEFFKNLFGGLNPICLLRVGFGFIIFLAKYERNCTHEEIFAWALSVFRSYEFCWLQWNEVEYRYKCSLFGML